MQNKGSNWDVEPLVEQTGRGTNPCHHRILVVDDDDDIRRLNAEALSNSGYHVDAAEDGAAGWDALNANRYDLLITDHNMPKLTGVELIKKLHSARMAVPVILASGVISGGESGLPLAAMLPKPYTVVQLLGTVKQVLSATMIAREGEEAPRTGQSPPSSDGLRL